MLNTEYKRPVMDRDFNYDLFCAIYGLGALGIYVLLRFVSGSPIELYTTSMAMVITMELATINIMVRLFGSFWWDYSCKPLNYKGAIYLKDSLGWRLLDLFFPYFLNIKVHTAVFSPPSHIGPVLAAGSTMFYLVDFIHCSRLRLGGMEEENVPTVGRLKIY